MNTYKVKSIRNVNWNNSIVRASIDLETPDGLVIRDCLLKEGQFGWFLEGPSKKLKEPFVTEDGKTLNYLGYITIPKHLRDTINRICCEAYDPAGNYQTTQAQAAHPMTAKAETMFDGTTEADEGMPA